MRRQVVLDEFFNNQPERKFIKDLMEYEIAEIKFSEPSDNEFAVKGAYIETGAFSGDKYLEEVWADFDRFADKNGVKGNAYPVKIQKADGFEVEEYAIDIKKDGATITASETEGVRRGVLRFEEMLVQGFGNLEEKNVREKAVIKRRISRGFFAPINRPPKGANELADDVNYYPDPYLNRMMHDGVNSLWVYSDFDSLVESSYITEFGKGREKAIEKLNKLIERTKRYGMEIFMFLIAPMSLFEPAIASKYPGIAQKYPQVHGNSQYGPTAFCVYTEFGAGYLKEASEGLIKSAPGLGGIMSITWGERVTSCGNTWGSPIRGWKSNCPHCGDKSKVDSITRTIQLFKEGMNAVNPKYDFISWTYGLRGASDEQIEEYMQKLPQDAIAMVNFEDDGRVYQLGKKRFAFDYYLCYPGPSRMYKKAAELAKKYNKEMYAKMQICCSHELASVPYIPVPGLIYNKMMGAKETGTTGVMECWFFGSYPCIMSRAVGMLSNDKVYATKQDFLFDLAKSYWSKKDVPHAVSAWEYFEKAYTSYPVNVMFNYYGPMHDGVVWDLQLKPKNFGLPRTWQLMDKTDGDRIGECMFYGHTIDEIIILAEEICFNWSKGCEQLSFTDGWNDAKNEQVNIAKALNILFNSGLNILKFYRHRQNIGYGRADAKTSLDAMREIVLKEIKNSEDMIPLCEADNRLGWHSEAEGYKFHPEKLKARIEKLKILLETEFKEVEERIKKGLVPLTYYIGEEEDVIRAKAGRNGIESAEWNTFCDGEDKGSGKFRIAENGDNIELEIKLDGKNSNDNVWVTFETELMWPQNTYIFMNDGSCELWREGPSHQSVNDERYDEFRKKWKMKNLSENGETHVLGTISKKDIQFVRFPFKLNVHHWSGSRWAHEVPGCGSGYLGKNRCTPGEFGWIDQFNATYTTQQCVKHQSANSYVQQVRACLRFFVFLLLLVSVALNPFNFARAQSNSHLRR